MHVSEHMCTMLANQGTYISASQATMYIGSLVGKSNIYITEHQVHIPSMAAQMLLQSSCA